MAIEPVNVGIVGCGNISGTYFTHCKEMEALEVVACSDIILERAEASAEKFDIPTAGHNEAVFDNPDVELVICLTPPLAHTEIMQAALAAGKHAYTEKPFAICREDGRATLAAAAEKGLLVGGAPDTFFGGGIQTCRKLIDEGAIGEPVAATAFMLSSGVESWHPDPEFFYEPGGGPMLDMGPYYLTALVNLLGPIRRVAGRARISFAERTITSEKKRGQKIPVQTPTHIAGVMDFACGAVGTAIMSFDVQAHNLPRIEIYGSQATLSVPDPNTFGGPVRIGRKRNDWEEIESMRCWRSTTPPRPADSSSSPARASGRRRCRWGSSMGRWMSEAVGRRSGDSGIRRSGDGRTRNRKRPLRLRSRGADAYNNVSG